MKVILLFLLISLTLISLENVGNKKGCKIIGGRVVLFNLQEKSKGFFEVLPYKYDSIDDFEVKQECFIYINFILVKETANDFIRLTDTLETIALNFASPEENVDSLPSIHITNMLNNSSLIESLLPNCNISIGDQKFRLGEETIKSFLPKNLLSFKSFYNDRQGDISKDNIHDLVFSINTFKIPTYLKCNGLINLEMKFANRNVHLEGFRYTGDAAVFKTPAAK